MKDTDIKYIMSGKTADLNRCILNSEFNHAKEINIQDVVK